MGYFISHHKGLARCDRSTFWPTTASAPFEYTATAAELKKFVFEVRVTIQTEILATANTRFKLFGAEATVIELLPTLTRQRYLGRQVRHTILVEKSPYFWCNTSIHLVLW